MTGCRILYHHRIRADDGQAVHVRELIGAFREEGHEVLECALVQKAGLAAGPGGDARTRGKGGLWNRLRLPRGAIELLEIAYGRQGARRLCRAAAGFRPDFVYERHALHCDAGLRAARALGVPLLLEVNSPFVDEMAALGSLRFPRRARRTEREVLAGADVVFAVTGVLRDLCIGLGASAERTVVVPNGAVPERYDDAARAAGRELRSRLSIAPDDFVLGFVGFMRPWHRLDLAVEMLLSPELRALHLVLVGEGPARRDIAAAAARAGVSGRVHAIGAVEPGELPGCVCAFDAALIPAINRYASPLKLFDSLAAGVPTICPRQPNLEELVVDGRNAVLFTPGDADALRAATARLVLDREAARRIGAQGRDDLLANDWTWRGNARRVITAYRRLVPGTAVPR